MCGSKECIDASLKGCNLLDGCKCTCVCVHDSMNNKASERELTSLLH